jgi:dTMP kinase
LQRAGIAARQTREPGGSPGAEAVRRLLLEGPDGHWDAVGEALLLNAARREHFVRVIRPALAHGVWVVCDRFADSTLAYQGYGHGLPIAKLSSLQHFAIGNFMPDITFILDLPVVQGLARAARRAGEGDADRFERLDSAFHERLRVGFRRIAAADPARCVMIDAAGDVASVHRAITAALRRRLDVPLVEATG